MTNVDLELFKKVYIENAFVGTYFQGNTPQLHLRVSVDNEAVDEVALLDALEAKGFGRVTKGTHKTRWTAVSEKAMFLLGALLNKGLTDEEYYSDESWVKVLKEVEAFASEIAATKGRKRSSQEVYTLRKIADSIKKGTAQLGIEPDWDIFG